MTSYFLWPLLLALSFTLDIMASTQEQRYSEERNKLIEDERLLGTGSKLKLSKNEKIYDALLVSLKVSELREASSDDGFFFPANNFVKNRHRIGNSKVHQMIEKMPKGGLLHLHDLAMTSPLWLIKKASYRSDCYSCVSNGQTLFKLAVPAPTDTKDCKWRLVNDLRKESPDSSVFDNELADKITIVNYSMKNEEDKSQPYIWKAFDQAFVSILGLIFHPDILPEYLREGLDELRKDGGNYCEIRTLLGPITDSSGIVYDKDWVVKEYIRVIEEFKVKHPDFIGAKLIYCDHRLMDKATIKTSVLKAIELHEKYPNYVVGYDLVGREDSGHALKYFLDDFINLPKEKNVNLPFYFHAGETDWQQQNVDENLIDAVLLNSRRIGHAYALTKHPLLMKMVKERGLAVELNPISNQVLLLVSDLRNHPGSVLLANGVACVVNSDDPAMWASRPLTDDYYVTFMALLGRRDGLASLKQLIINSITYSAMNEKEQKVALAMHDKSWNAYINSFVEDLQ